MTTRNGSTEILSGIEPGGNISFMPRSSISRGLALACMFLLALGACQTPRMASAGEKNVTVKGRVLVDHRAPGRVRLFFASQKPGIRSKEIPTNASGEFNTKLPPGIYRIRASPTSACPIRNTLVIPPSQKGELSILLKTTPLGFMTCKPSHIALLSATGMEESALKRRPLNDIGGFWTPAPGVSATLFLDADPSNGTLRQIPVDPKGHFPIKGISPGTYKLVATIAGFCPVSVRFSVHPAARYLVLRVPRFHPGSPCAGASVALHDRAFALPEGG